MTEDSGIDSDPKNNVNIEDETLFAVKKFLLKKFIIDFVREKKKRIIIFL